MPLPNGEVSIVSYLFEDLERRVLQVPETFQPTSQGVTFCMLNGLLVKASLICWCLLAPFG